MIYIFKEMFLYFQQTEGLKSQIQEKNMLTMTQNDCRYVNIHVYQFFKYNLNNKFIQTLNISEIFKITLLENLWI